MCSGYTNFFFSMVLQSGALTRLLSLEASTLSLSNDSFEGSDSEGTSFSLLLSSIFSVEASSSD